jgi:YD repeat-containing protein
MKILHIILVSTLFLVYAATAGARTDRERAGLMGSVRTVQVEIAKLSPSDQSAEEPRVLSQAVTYNAQGIATETVTYGAEGGKRVTTYDGQSKKTTISYKPDGSIEWKVVGTCDDQGNLTEADHYDARGSFQWKQVYTYDAQRNMIEQVWRNPPGGPDSSPFFKEIWTYDAQGRAIQKVQYTAEVPDLKSPTSKCEYTYDGAGKVTEITYDIFGARPKSEKLRYTYEAYDTVENWTKRTKAEWVTSSGQPSFRPIEVTYRTITYY